MFIGEIDKCTHILTAYISSSYDYCNFLDTQLDKVKMYWEYIFTFPL